MPRMISIEANDLRRAVDYLAGLEAVLERLAQPGAPDDLAGVGDVLDAADTETNVFEALRYDDPSTPGMGSRYVHDDLKEVRTRLMLELGAQS